MLHIHIRWNSVILCTLRACFSVPFLTRSNSTFAKLTKFGENLLKEGTGRWLWLLADAATKVVFRRESLSDFPSLEYQMRMAFYLTMVNS